MRPGLCPAQYAAGQQWLQMQKMTAVRVARRRGRKGSCTASLAHAFRPIWSAVRAGFFGAASGID
jgi:hypothetical protein